MANLTGLLTCSVILLLVLNVIPGVDISLAWQAIAAICLGATNLLVWRGQQIEPMSFRDAAITAALGCLIVGALAVVDTLVGFAFGERTMWGAFIHSGAFGGIADVFLIACGSLIGIPALARSVYLYHAGRSDKATTL